MHRFQLIDFETENAMVLVKWGVVDITAVHMHRDAYMWGPPACPLIAKDSLLEIHY
jgi:hypothetical protein